MAKKLIVQKYGGATLATPEKVKAVALRVSDLVQSGYHVVVAVSAMGSTTNQLIDLAQQVSKNPVRRELDMLLTTGERVSMALLSMALHDLNCPAISLTGSQAGILTDDSHVSAFITDVKAFRVEESLKKDKVVVLAGFQGVSPITKEITTLGRGGTDTTAVAMAAYLNADHCEILKDVPSILSADPKIVKDAKPIPQLTYDQLLDMTFWGAKVLHYRSVELAKRKQVSIFVGPAENKNAQGTWVKGENMFEATQVIAINSHQTAILISTEEKNSETALKNLLQIFDEQQIADPQILKITNNKNQTEALITGPSEVVKAIQNCFTNKNKTFKIEHADLSTVSLTCAGATSPKLVQNISKALSANNIHFSDFILGPMSATVVVPTNLRDKTIQELHKLIS